ncbi:MAG: outer membrane protein transport protein [Gammaproteobacteria bacterium]|nr:outer membrane protein transport protein [Gammaproteobacteria bacterium]MBT8436534.1 outer membrane protein transport protein [Gammaproteobacteria bacterium]
MRVRLKKISFALLVFTFPAAVWATNGYFSHGTSLAEKGLAGAGVAYSQDTLAAANNPAGMVWQGERYDVGIAAFAPMRDYSSEGSPSVPAGGICGAMCPFSIGNGDQSIDSENELFLIPQFGYNWEIDDNRTIGISVFGNGGLNTEYKDGVALLGPMGTQLELPGTFGDGTAGVDLAQLFISTTYAAKISDTTSWGVSGIIAYQRFEAKGLANFGGFSTDPGNLTNNSHDTATGIGIRLGIQTEISPGIRFGAAYQPEIDMSEFDDYAGLFAEEGDFDIPSNFTVGLAIDVRDHGVLVVDIQRINYEDVPAVSNPITPLTPTDTSCMPGMMGGTGDGCLGGDDGAGFGWEDMTVVKIGYQWQDGDMTWRVGYSTGDQPIPSSEVVFNILAPGVIEEHFTFGFTRQIDAQSSFNFAAMYAPNNSVDGTNTFDPSQEIEIEMDQYELAFSYNRRL